MELLNRIKLFFSNFTLKQRLKRIKRHKKFNNLRNAHKIAIVWDGSNIEDFKAITDFFQEMQKRNIQVDVVCYYPKNILPDEYTLIRYLTCIKQSDLSFLLFPKSDDIEEFINTPYEILIDINNNNYFPVKYVTVMSRAQFKVGSESSAYSDNLDMTIKMTKEYDPAYYLQQVKYYLEMINTGA